MSRNAAPPTNPPLDLAFASWLRRLSPADEASDASSLIGNSVVSGNV